MDLGPTHKPPVHFGGLSSKQLIFLGIAGVILVVGVVLRNVVSSDEPAGEETTPVAVEAAPPAPKTTSERLLPETPPATQEAATPPSPPVEQTGEAVQQTGDQQAGDAAEPALPGSDMILVARRPVELLSEPSTDGAVMFGFPAGRPFRVIGEENGFVQIKDEKSGASGWIDKSALAAPPPRAPVVTTRARPKPGAGGRGASPRRNAGQSDSAVADELQSAVEPPKRPGLFGGGGIFGGLFSK